MSSILPHSGVINEDVALVNGVDAACGPTASYIAAGIVDDFGLSAQGLQQLVADAIRAGTLNTGGQAFSGGPQWDLNQYGIGSTQTSPGNAAQLQTTLDNALRQNKPAVLGLANASHLTNESAGLRGHFATVVGTTSKGDYVVSDPNLGAMTDNSLGQLFAAQPVTVTVPNRGASGTPIKVNNTAGLNISELSIGNNSNIGGLPSLFTVQLPDISTGISTGLETVIGDIFPFTKINNWLQNFLTRAIFVTLGGVIFIISFDYFLGTFKATIPQQGPILTSIGNARRKAKEAQQALQEKGKEIGETAAVAAV